MAVKHFHVATPEQLQTLVQFAKADASTIARMARIWRAAKDKHEHTHWDHGIYIYFSGDRQREAAIARLAAGDELVIVGQMKYNLALNWCEQHLRQVYDSLDYGDGSKGAGAAIVSPPRYIIKPQRS